MNKGRKFACFFATEKGYSVLNHIIEKNEQKSIGLVVSFKETNVRESYYERIESLCKDFSIPFFAWSDITNELPDLISKHSITNIVAVSWRFLLPITLNSLLKDDIIVFHDSLLPKYRGFAPTPTAVICGETQVGVSAIFASEDVDKGDIILQKKLDISDNEAIKSIITRQSILMAEMFSEIIEIATNGKLTGQPQNDEKATYSIWRNVDDCHIDWSKSAKDINNLVRAVSFPYHGAFCFMDGKKVIIEEAEVVQDLNFEIRDCGKIWAINDGNPTIICGIGMLKILSAFDEKEEKVTFDKVRVRLT